jgi:predicted phosphodiesterase
MADAHAVLNAESGGVVRNATFEQRIPFIDAIPGDFIVLVGDLVEGYCKAPELEQMWDDFAELSKRIGKRIVKVPGNHDIYDADSARIWSERHGRTYYSFEHEGAHFVVLSSEERTAPDAISGDQLAWLEKDLAGATSAHQTFVFVHKPLWLYETSNWQSEVHPLLARHGVDRVIAGHFHRYGLYPAKDGVEYVVASSIGRDLPHRFGGFPSVLSIEVDAATSSFRVLHPAGVELPSTVLTPRMGDERGEPFVVLDSPQDAKGKLAVPIELSNPTRHDLDVRVRLLGDGTAWRSSEASASVPSLGTASLSVESHAQGKPLPLPALQIAMLSHNVPLIETRISPRVAVWAEGRIAAKIFDDFEDGDLFHRGMQSGITKFRGPWLAKCDALGRSTIAMPVVQRTSIDGKPTRALHVTGFFGARIGNDYPWAILEGWLGGEGKHADLGGSVGVRFRARAPQPSTVRFAVEGTVGDTRTAATGAGHGIELPMSDDWKSYMVLWQDMAQPTWACPGPVCTKGPLEVTKVEYLSFAFMKEGAPIDFWLDDVKVLYAD